MKSTTFEDETDENDVYVGPKTLKHRKQVEDMKNILQECGWLRNNYEGTMTLTDTDRLLPPYHTRTAWNNLVKSERLQYTSNKLVNLPPKNSENHKRKNWDDVEILGYDYFFPTSEEAVEKLVDLKDLVIKRFNLNVEQSRAFGIVADHASVPQRVPLRMYMGGMGGTGKSEVINSLALFFEQRNEAYRFMIVGPTGSVAAQLNGSTYHSVFRISRDNKSKNRDDIDGIRNEDAAYAAVNERLQGVWTISLLTKYRWYPAMIFNSCLHKLQKPEISMMSRLGV